MGLICSSICRRCVAENETSAHVLCECEPLASLKHAYLGSIFLDSEDIKSLNLGAIWKFRRGTWLHWVDIRKWCTTSPCKVLGASGPIGIEPNYYSLHTTHRCLPQSGCCVYLVFKGLHLCKNYKMWGGGTVWVPVALRLCFYGHGKFVFKRGFEISAWKERTNKAYLCWTNSVISVTNTTVQDVM